MKLLDSEDLVFVPPILLALAVRRIPIAAPRRILAHALGKLACVISRRKRRKIEKALLAAYGLSLSERETQAIVLRSLRSVWEEMFQLVAGPAARSEFNGCEVKGLEHLQSSLAKGRGAILWESNGMGARWMPKRILLEHGFGVHQIHGYNNLGGFLTLDAAGSRLKADFIKPFFDRCETYFLSGASYLPRNGSLGILRELERRLRRNEIICSAADGPLGHLHLSLPFLGSNVRFSTGMVSLAKLTGADLLPMFCVRTPEGGYKLTVEGPINLKRLESRKENYRASLAEYSQLLESCVRRYPAQYRNWHLTLDCEKM